MRITIESKELTKALAVASSMAGRDRTLPILDCVKCVVRGLAMSVTSFNNEIAVRRMIPLLSSEGDMSFCINARDFLAYSRTVKGEVAVIDISEDLKTCSFVHDRGEMNLPLLPVEDFPAITNEERRDGFVIDASLLREWVSISAGFVGSDKLRPVTANMWIYVDGGKIGCCASDSFKMFLDESPANPEWKSMQMLIQNSAFKVIADACADAEYANIKVGDNTYIVSVGATTILCRKVEYKYPDVRKVVPSTCDHSAAVNTTELGEAVERALLAADTKTMLLKFEIVPGMLTISSEDVMNSKKNKESVECLCECTKMFSVQGENFLRCLNTCSGETVTLSFNESERSPIICKGADDEGRKLLAMPLVAM